MNPRLKRAATAALFAAMAVAVGPASADFDPKRCYEKCMEKEKDREKCEYVCDYKGLSRCADSLAR
ncbi:hypothetical protein [Roseateles sp.]|uniref:hypothetical protein n=1 Tax=Roseateles sp. TaxID=1971397 RepID=UPI0031E3C865